MALNLNVWSSRSVKREEARTGNSPLIGSMGFGVVLLCLISLALEAQPVHGYENHVRKLGVPSSDHFSINALGDNVIGEWKFGKLALQIHTPNTFLVVELSATFEQTGAHSAAVSSIRVT